MMAKFPSKDKRIGFLKTAYLQAEENSKDPSTKIGAVLVDDYGIITTGYNGFPRKVKDYKVRYADRDIKYQYVVHAEHNAILTAARRGAKTDGSTLFVPCEPCNECVKAIIQAGVVKIVVHKQWKKLTHSKWPKVSKVARNMLREAKIPIEYLDKVLGVRAYINYQIYEL